MSFLTRKYPFPQSGPHWYIDCGIYSIIVFLILLFLQPFGFSMYQGNKFLVSLLFGIVTFCCCALYGVAVCMPLTKRVKPWRIWHQALNELGLILMIGICNFLLFSQIFHYPIKMGYFLAFLYWTLIIGFFISAVAVSINYHRQLRNQLGELLNKTTEQQTGVVITIHDTSVRGSDLQLPINDLLYIEAQKNNVSVCYMKDGKTETTELHTTLTAVLDDLREYGNIFQCHRSFVVNLNNITSAQGNSNGYQLKLGNCPSTIPVSRTFVPKLKSFIA